MKKLVSVLLFFAFQPAFGITENEVQNAIKEAGGPDKFLMAMTKSLASQAPLVLDSETTLVSAVSFGVDAHLNHQLVGVRGKFDWRGYEREQALIISHQRNKVCSGDVWSVLLNKYNASGNYRYYARNGDLLFSFSVDKKHCQKR